MEGKHLLFFIIPILGVTGQTLQGPVFLLEPPTHLTFSNATGSQVSCSAHGSPTPDVQWLLQDGQPVTAVPGLRQSLGNGTLYFPPFRAEDYRKDVHSTIYRCRASNLAGIIISRDVNVRAVVTQHYDVQVHHAHVLSGNTAVLGCVIPTFVKEHVTVTSWSKDESIILPGSNMGGRVVVTYGTGELHIRSARAEDGLARYSCMTRHALTQERKKSSPAILSVTEATGSTPPRLAPTIQRVIAADRETDVHLTCSAQGNPPPIFHWFKEIEGHLQAISASSRYEPSQDILLIRRLKPEDNGRWVCKVVNQFGEQHLDIHLTVTEHLSTHVLPQVQVVNSGDTGIFNCTVSGSPIGQVQWLKNGEVMRLDDNLRITLLDPLILAISKVNRHDKGMYQCLVQNERDNCQGSAELRLGDTIPEFQDTFIEQAMRPGIPISLGCTATGSPPPQFRWLLDGEPITDLESGHRLTISQRLNHGGDVISHLNISRVKVTDGGLYSCKAYNTLGYTEHAARLNVYGPPFIREVGPVKAVANTEINLHCPYSGYPIGSVKWEHRGQKLPLDLHHELNEGGSLTISKLDPSIDAGFYTCFVTNGDGQVARRDIKLEIHSPPVIEAFAFPLSLQEGSRAQVTCYVTSGDMPIVFAWTKDGDPIPHYLQVEERSAEFFSMLIFNKVMSTHSGFYTCIAGNSAAKSNYTAQLMVKVSPQWVMEPHDVAILLGNSMLIECTARGFPQPQISWLKGKGKISSEFQPVIDGRSSTLLANGSMILEAITSHDEGYYMCRASNGIGAGVSKVIYVAVNEPVRFDIPNRNISVKLGKTARLLCHVYGDSPIDVSWTINGNRLEIYNMRFSITETRTENGVKCELNISNTDRRDSATYKCVAENAFGRGEHTINLAVQEKPDPPNSIEVVEIVSRSIRIAWDKPFDGNSPVLRYVVQYQILGFSQGEWQHANTINVSLPATVRSAGSTSDDHNRESTIVNGLYPASVYTIRMAAVNEIDQSMYTNPLIVKTQEESPSAPPRDIQVDAISPSELFVIWSVPSKDTWNGELLGYIVSWNELTNPSNYSKSITVKGWATTKLQLKDLKKFTKYNINVRAFNSIAMGPASATVVGITKEGFPEAPPQNIVCTPTSSQIIKLAWEPPPANLHGGSIQGYKVFYRPLLTENIPNNAEVKRTASSETYLHGLYKYTNYSIKVLAYTGAGDGVLSHPMFCTTEEDLPGRPSDIKAAALTGDSILVSWLPPSKPNGRIIHYTIYHREVGRVGKHTNHIVRVEDSAHSYYDLIFEVRNLVEHQLYEFWVSATTNAGEGEPTAIVAQATNTRAPSRIASFSQIISTPMKAKVFLPCLAVGNPTPRTRWIHHSRPITFSPFYEVTGEGHLSIHRADESLAGNYTCTAKNLFGEDDITYTVIVLMTPSAPTLEIQFNTAKSIRLHWTPPQDGGAIIQGYMLFTKYDTEEWSSLELSAENTLYTLENLRCGSVYHSYLLAYNRVGSGHPSSILRFTTRGGTPQIPKDKDFIVTNATSIQLNLYNWPDGGCPITQFSLKYKPAIETDWNLISNSVSERQLVIHDLTPSTWYQLQITALNDAGLAKGLFNCATTTITGENLIPPPMEPEVTPTTELITFEGYIISSTIVIVIFIFLSILLWYGICEKDSNSGSVRAENENNDDKISIKSDNRRNCEPVYSSSPLKVTRKHLEESSEMYEISPYATFSVPGSNSRSVTTSTLDYAMQFKTFGHIEVDEGHNLPICPKVSKHRWRKHRSYPGTSTTPIPEETRSRRLTDSDSEDTSGSPSDFPQAPSKFRIPIDSSRDERVLGRPHIPLTCTGYETLLVEDLFRPDASTESNDISPSAERVHTPHRVELKLLRRHQHPSSSSIEALEQTSKEEALLKPPAGFAHREMTEIEYEEKYVARKSSIDLETMLLQYQEQMDQERKQFIIHV